MMRTNPTFIPRNHLIAAAIDSAEEHGDFSKFHALVDVLREPFEYRPELAKFASPPRPEERVCATLCGT